MDRRQDTRGFTMVELLMVVTIIGILLAIVVPTFLGARRGANDRTAQSVVRHLLVSARAVASQGEDADTIQAGEPALRVVGADAEGNASENEVSVWVGEVAGRSFVILASRSTSGTCFAILEPQDGSTGYQQLESGACRASAFDPSTGWSDQWQ